MAAISLLSCNSYLPRRQLLPPPHSFLVGRRTLFIRPVMTIDDTAFSSSIHLDQAPVLSASRDQDNPISKPKASQKMAGITLPLSSLVNAPIWTKFLLGSVVLLAIPFLRRFLGTKDVLNEVEKGVGMVEMVAEAVEKVVEVVEEAAEEIAEALPDGSLKEDAVKIEKIALLVDKNAEVTEYIVNKIDKAIEELERNRNPEVKSEEAEKNGVAENMNAKIEGNESKEKGMQS